MTPLTYEEALQIRERREAERDDLCYDCEATPCQDYEDKVAMDPCPCSCHEPGEVPSEDIDRLLATVLALLDPRRRL